MAKSQLLKDLISLGKKQGYLTYDDINKKISDKEMSSDKIDSLFVDIAELGVKIVDKKSSAHLRHNKIKTLRKLQISL